MDGIPVDEAARPSADADRQICCTVTSVLLRLVRSEGGETTVAQLLERARATHEAAYLEDVDNWISLDEAGALLEAGVVETGDSTFARRVGEQVLNQHAGTPVATLLRSLGSPEAILAAVAQTAAKFSTVTELEAVEVGPGHAQIRAAAREGFTRRAELCDWTTGMLSAAPSLFGLPAARVHESECQARGGSRCLYNVSWDAELAVVAADPRQRVTALEAQLGSVSERLRSAYGTASDLVSTEEIGTVLQRIVERAANAVRAPGFVLALSSGPDSDLQVYSHGIESREAQVLALATRAGKAPLSDSTLVVDVASSRRRYGQLIARYPGGSEFFPQDRAMLTLYAKHAAAVLDTATALQQSAERHDQVSSLLSLSHALAQAGTSEEVAERLAASVPAVVDCDRMAVWLWEEDSERLRSLATWAREPLEAGLLLGLTVSPADTPQLGRMAAEPQPMFFDATTDDPLLSGLMDTLDASMLAIVPIVVRDVFLGALSVLVSDRPQRLAPDQELIDRLTGVAALAAPAIQNGRLVDQLRHEASHDGLTGLLNRFGFKLHIDRVLDEARRGGGRAGLLFVDLNDFKGVNDVHGHDVGDELIRQVAERLQALCRAGDEVARLGGDEFAIVLADVEHDGQLLAAEARVRDAFTEPLPLGDVSLLISASVGGGIWPEDGPTVKDLVRRADAAMYRNKTELRVLAGVLATR
jgi:diguanylate cyclase (GGDEF)-like protein